MAEANRGHGEKSSRKQEIFLARLLTEPSIKEAARKAGIGEATGWRWLQDTDFQNEYQKARRMAVSQAIAQLQQASSAAVDTLRQIMADIAATPASRVSAARTVLDTSLKAIELEDLAQRIAQLEDVMAERNGGNKSWV